MAYQKVYMNQIHSSSLLCQLSQMWRNQVLCDAYIRTGSITTKAHRVVLVAACPMLQSMDGASVGSQLEVRLTADIQKEAVNTFLQYLYEGFMMLTEDNVRDVEKIARLLQVDSVTKCCSDFLQTLQKVVGGSGFSGSQYKYSFQDQVEFRHVRASDLLRSMQNGADKRPADVEEVRRKRLRGDNTYSPTMSPRTATDDSSFMLNSYTDTHRQSQQFPQSSLRRMGYGASQAAGGRHVVEDGFEFVQSDLDSNASSSSGRERTVGHKTSGVAVTVASQITPQPDVETITIPDVSDSDRTQTRPSQPHFSVASATKTTPSSFSFGGSISSPRSKSSSSSQPVCPSPTFSAQKSTRPSQSPSRPETGQSVSLASEKTVQEQSKQTSSTSMPVSSEVKSKDSGDGEKPEQIVIQPMSLEPPSPLGDITRSSQSESAMSSPREKERSKPSATVTSGSLQEESDNSRPCSTPDISIVKVERSGSGAEGDGAAMGLDMHVEMSEEYGQIEEEEDEGSDMEMYAYGDMSVGDGQRVSGDQANSWYIQTLKGEERDDKVQGHPPQSGRRKSKPMRAVPSLKMKGINNNTMAARSINTKQNMPFLEKMDRSGIVKYNQSPTSMLLGTSSQETPLDLSDMVVTQRVVNVPLADLSEEEATQITEIQMSSYSRQNFTWKLVQFYFKDHELEGHNCYGRRGKPALDESRLTKIKMLTFLYYPVSVDEEETRAWQNCVIAVDKGIRNTFSEYGCGKKNHNLFQMTFDAGKWPGDYSS